MCTNTYLNKERYDKVIAKTKWCSFLCLTVYMAVVTHLDKLIQCSTRQQCQRTGILAFHTRFSRVFHPCLLVPRFPLPRISTPAILMLPRYPLFSRPLIINRLGPLLHYYRLQHCECRARCRQTLLSVPRADAGRRSRCRARSSQKTPRRVCHNCARQRGGSRRMEYSRRCNTRICGRIETCDSE